MRTGLAISLLASGAGTRFGGGKLDADCAGAMLGSYSLQAALAAEPANLAIVVPPIAPRFVAATLEGHGKTADLIVNPEAAQGLATSVACAARWAMERKAHCLIVMLADMPLITAQDLIALAELATMEQPSACEHGDGRPGVPVCWPAKFLPQLASLDDRGIGAGPLLARAQPRNLAMPAERLRDVDTTDDLAIVAQWIARHR